MENYLIPKRNTENIESIFDLFNLDFEKLSFAFIDKLITEKLLVIERGEIIYDNEVYLQSTSYRAKNQSDRLKDTVQVKAFHKDNKLERNTRFYLPIRERALFDEVILIRSDKPYLELKANFICISELELTAHIAIKDLRKLIDDISAIYGEDYEGNTGFSEEEEMKLAGYNCTWSRQWNGIRIYLDSTGITLQLFLFALSK